MSHPTKDWREEFREQFLCKHKPDTSTCLGGQIDEEVKDMPKKLESFIQEQIDIAYERGRQSVIDELD